MSGVYYNEIDPFAAAWLRELIKDRLIADGEVDTRSIEDVRPDDLRGFDQCHFFAGIGGWSLALRRAGWPDDRPVWTGSCPCQPFSSAGQGAGFNDERHLWPSFHWLIQECRPAGILGEQVASKDADPWLDLVQDDLEALGYAFGAVAFPSAGVGAPHIRDRTYWMAYADGQQRPGGKRAIRTFDEARGRQQGATEIAGFRDAVRLAQHNCYRRSAPTIAGVHDAEYHAESCCGAGGLADAHNETESGRGIFGPGESLGASHGASCQRFTGLRQADTRGSPTNGFWRAADWLFCRDGKWRPVEPGSKPLAYGLPASVDAMRAESRRLAEVAGLDAASLRRAKAMRVGALRGFGNAINAEQATLFVEVMAESILQLANK